MKSLINKILVVAIALAICVHMTVLYWQAPNAMLMIQIAGQKAFIPGWGALDALIRWLMA